MVLGGQTGRVPGVTPAMAAALGPTELSCGTGAAGVTNQATRGDAFGRYLPWHPTYKAVGGGTLLIFGTNPEP